MYSSTGKMLLVPCTGNRQCTFSTLLYRQVLYYKYCLHVVSNSTWTNAVYSTRYQTRTSTKQLRSTKLITVPGVLGTSKEKYCCTWYKYKYSQEGVFVCWQLPGTVITTRYFPPQNTSVPHPTSEQSSRYCFTSTSTVGEKCTG